MKYQTIYTLELDDIENLRDILEPCQFEDIMLMTKISYIDGAESLFAKYQDQLELNIDALSLIFYNLTNGNFKSLQNYPSLTASTSVMLELFNMFGLAMLDYVDPVCWQDYEFVIELLNNHTNWIERSYKIRNNEFHNYHLDDIITKIDAELFDENMLSIIMESPYYIDIDKLMPKFHKYNYKMYQYWLSRRYSYNVCHQNYVEMDKIFILDQIKQCKFNILHSIDHKLWQQPEFIDELITEMELIIKTNFCIPIIYLEKITGMLVTNDSLDRDRAKRLIELQPKLLSYMTSSQVICKELIELALQRDHILVEALAIDLKLFDNSELLKLVKTNGLLIQYLGKEYRQNDPFVYAALNQNPLALEFVDMRYRDNDKLVLECILRNTACYEFVSPRLKQSIEIAQITLNSNCFAVYLLEENLKNRLNIVEEELIANYLNNAMKATINDNTNAH